MPTLLVFVIWFVLFMIGALFMISSEVKNNAHNKDFKWTVGYISTITSTVFAIWLMVALGSGPIVLKKFCIEPMTKIEKGIITQKITYTDQDNEKVIEKIHNLFKGIVSPDHQVEVTEYSRGPFYGIMCLGSEWKCIPTYRVIPKNLPEEPVSVPLTPKKMKSLNRSWAAPQ